MTDPARDIRQALPGRGQICGNCEYYDIGAASGPDGFSDCLNARASRFQTKRQEWCAEWFLDTTLNDAGIY